VEDVFGKRGSLQIGRKYKGENTSLIFRKLTKQGGKLIIELGRALSP
jgi:hypothetical protein